LTRSVFGLDFCQIPPAGQKNSITRTGSWCGVGSNNTGWTLPRVGRPRESQPCNVHAEELHSTENSTLSASPTGFRGLALRSSEAASRLPNPAAFGSGAFGFGV
jgi:hypothetical protein